jgi:LAS superfamily LD-carboxypeptidase LdcB
LPLQESPSELSALHDDLEPLADSLLSWAAARGIPAAVVSVYRTREHQADLYRNRASNPYPVAPPGFSKHETGRAFDLWSPDLDALGEHWERLGGRWGGRFNDPVHFED